MSRRSIFVLAVALIGLALPGWPGGVASARAAAGVWLDHEQARLRLVASSESVGDRDSLRLGVQFKLAPGWKIYWRSPGDAGFAPSLDWSASENLAEAELRWPVPHRFSLFGMETFGYSDEVILPVVVTPERPGQPLRLRASINYLICSEVCVPHDGELALDLPAGPWVPSSHMPTIALWNSLVPRDGADVGLSLDKAVLTGPVEQPVLQIVASSTLPFRAPDVLVEGPPGFAFGKPEVLLNEAAERAVLRVRVQRDSTTVGVLEGKRITLTVIDGQRGMETSLVARHDRLPEAAGAPLLAILGLALLGGLILNLMPCVLPVLSIKLLSVVKHSGRNRGEIRLSFLVTAAGIIFSFLILALVAMALKAGGMTAGWGIQFQQPLFLTVMALIVMLFAYNLFGLFEITLPARLADIAPAGGGERHSLRGDFLTGAFATLLATPCSAPFLGTAVGFALARGPGEILLVFTALGVGLALPYLLVAAVPALAAHLPRPGHWMVTLRRILGLALVATALWLLSVIAVQATTAAALVIGALLAVIGALFYLRRHWRRPALSALISLLALGAVLSPAGFAAPERIAPKPVSTGDWLPLDLARIELLVADGKVVFVDVTADWCITCQVNKAVAIDREEVARRLAGDGIVAMRADWTLPSDEISDYLSSFGRYGIPFNAVYGPALPAGEALPELLSEGIVLRALDRAGG